jgi:hypothetical protein
MDNNTDVIVEKLRQQSAQPIKKGRFSKFEGVIVSRERRYKTPESAEPSPRKPV